MADEINLTREQLKYLAEQIGITSGPLRDLGESAKNASDSTRDWGRDFKKIRDEAVYGYKQLHTALSDTSNGFTKYNSVITAGTKTIDDFFSKFGVVGGVVGTVVQAFGALAKGLNIAQESYVKAYDEFAKLGGSVGLTTKDIENLGTEAGYTYHNLDKLVKSTKSAQDGLVQLGGSVSNGIKVFGKIAAVGDDTINAYRRMGVLQEELTEMQANYINQLAMTGGALSKTPQQLQKESLKYIDTLHQLAELTGIDVKKLQEKQNLALAQENFNAYIYDLEKQRANTTDAAKKAELENIIKNSKLYADFVLATDNAKTATAKLELISNKNGEIITESSAPLINMGFSASKVTENFSKANGGFLAIVEDYKQTAEGTKRVTEMLGDSVFALGPTSRSINEIFAYTNEARKKSADARRFFEMSDKEQKEYLDQLRKKIEDVKAEGQPGQEAIELAVRQREIENAYRKTLEEITKTLQELIPDITLALKEFARVLKDEVIPIIKNDLIPFLREHGKTIVRVTGFLTSLLLLAPLVNKFKDALGFGPKSLGTKGNPMHVVVDGGGLGGPGGPGGPDGRRDDRGGRGGRGRLSESQLEKYNELRKKGVPAAEAMRQAGGFSSIAKAEERLRPPSTPPSAPTSGGRLAQLGGAGMRALRGPAAIAGGLVLDYASQKAAEGGHEKTAAGLGIASQTAAYAGTGALIGSVVPGLGTTAGAILGGLYGFGMGLYDNRNVFGSNKPANAQKILDFIAQKESGGDYNILVGGKKAPLTDMTISQILNFQDTMRQSGLESTAVGKYQIIKDTLLSVMGPAGITLNDKFDQTTQDKLAIELLNRRQYKDFLDRKISAEQFADNLSMEWASLPYNTGRSYYDKVGSNKSHVSREDFIKTLVSGASEGIASGPLSGYPATLHGNELIKKITKDSILDKLAHTPYQESTQPLSSNSDSIDVLTAIKEWQERTYELMEDKFTAMLEQMEETYDVQRNIYRQTAN